MSDSQSINRDAFLALAKSTFELELPVSNAVITIRRAPFSMVMRVIAELTQLIQAEATVYSAEVTAAFKGVMDAARKDNAAAAKSGVDFLFRVFPAISGLVARVPGLLDTILLDVVVDASPSDIKNIPAEDAIEIVAETFKRMDKAVLARQVNSIFFGAAEVVKVATSALDAASKTTNQPPSESPE